jgi:hypothetical protein
MNCWDGIPVEVDPSIPPNELRVSGALGGPQGARVGEGYCPHGHGRLEIREDRPEQGWCEECRFGWSSNPKSVVLHITFETTR